MSSYFSKKPVSQIAKSALPYLILGSTTVIVSGIALLYTFQCNLIYTANYPKGSRKH
ncbi:24797_t:CDS:1, partial [Dentiscutata erythropus]